MRPRAPSGLWFSATSHSKDRKLDLGPRTSNPQALKPKSHLRPRRSKQTQLERPRGGLELPIALSCLGARQLPSRVVCLAPEAPAFSLLLTPKPWELRQVDLLNHSSTGAGLSACGEDSQFPFAPTGARLTTCHTSISRDWLPPTMASCHPGLCPALFRQPAALADCCCPSMTGSPWCSHTSCGLIVKAVPV